MMMASNDSTLYVLMCGELATVRNGGHSRRNGTERRMMEGNHGGCPSTPYLLPLEVVFLFLSSLTFSLPSAPNRSPKSFTRVLEHPITPLNLNSHHQDVVCSPHP